MQFILLLLLLAEGLHCSKAGGTKLEVTRSKAIQVVHHDGYVATDLLPVMFATYLPSMNDPDQLPIACEPRDGPSTHMFLEKSCLLLEELNAKCNELIKEINLIYAAMSKPSRVKRDKFVSAGVIPLIGSISKYLFGTATEGDVEKLITNLNSLGQDVKVLENQTATVVAATSSLAYKMQNFELKVEQRLQSIAKVHNELQTEVANLQQGADRIFAAQLVSAAWQTKLHILTVHLFTVNHIFNDCKNQKLSKLAIPQDQLRSLLESKEKQLNQTGLSLAIPLQNLEKYYENIKISCFFVPAMQLRIHFDLPIKNKFSNWNVFSMAPLKFLYESMTCSLFEKEIFFISDGTTARALPINPYGEDQNVFMVPRANMFEMDQCANAMIHSKELENIVEKCPLHCNKIMTTSFQEIDKDEFSILNPVFQLEIFCSGQLVEEIPPSVSGRIIVKLPCQCSVIQRDNIPPTTLLYPRTSCLLNERMMAGVSINRSWLNSSIKIKDIVFTDYTKTNLSLEPLDIDFKIVTPPTPVYHWGAIQIIHSHWFLISFSIISVIGLLLGISYCFITPSKCISFLALCKSAKNTTNRPISATPSTHRCPHDCSLEAP